MLVLLFALLAWPLMAPQSPSTADRTTDAKATAVITGRVVSGATGRPLRRAQIRLSAPGMREPRTTSTDATGEYEIADLPPGRYTINVTRSGHLPLQYGQRRYGETGSPVQVDEGQTLRKIDFALQRAGIIGGRILDDSGEPVAGVMVFAMQSQFFQGRRQLVPMAGYGSTDDTGQTACSACRPAPTPSWRQRARRGSPTPTRNRRSRSCRRTFPARSACGTRCV